MIHSKYKIFLAAILLFAGGCSKDLDRQPLDNLGNTTYWSSQADAERAVTDIYRFLGSNERFFISCATDDSYSWSNWPVDIQFVANGSASPGTGTFANFWKNLYQQVAKANDVTDNIDRVPNLEPILRARLLGEARFLRAYAYHQLTELFGDVPLITHIQRPDEFNVPRTPKADVTRFILDELTAITNDLPETYDASERGRITRGAVLALKARVALYNENWSEAVTAAKEVMDLGVYQIDNNYLSLFNGDNKTSNEIILAAQYLPNVYPNSNATWIGAPSLAGWGQIVPLKSLVDSYECVDGLPINESPLYDANTPFANRDPRLKLTIVVPGTQVNSSVIDITKPGSPDAIGQSNASFSGYYYKKYVPTTISGGWETSSAADVMIIRYAEVLLTYAEAKIEVGEIDQTVYDAINQVRQRSGVNVPAATVATHPDQSALRTLLRRERHVEFPLEDNRLFDIRRWRIAEQVMPGRALGIFNNFDNSRADYNNYVLVEQRNFDVNRDYLWPIPANEMSLNNNLTQNAGW